MINGVTLVVIRHQHLKGRPRDLLHPMDLLPPTPSWHRIVNEVAEKYRVPASLILAPCRFYHLMPARFECCWRLRYEFLWAGKQPSWLLIGRWLNRNHATVMHGARRHAATRAS